MDDIELKKKRLGQRKMRTRNLIELGGLIAKAKIDCMPKDTNLWRTTLSAKTTM